PQIAVQQRVRTGGPLEHGGPARRLREQRPQAGEQALGEPGVRRRGRDAGGEERVERADRVAHVGREVLEAQAVAEAADVRQDSVTSGARVEFRDLPYGGLDQLRRGPGGEGVVAQVLLDV